MLKVLCVLPPLQNPLIKTLKVLATSLVDFLKLPTTLKILNLFTILVKHSAFSSLVLRLFGKISGFVFCSFFVCLCVLVEMTSQHQLIPFSNSLVL